VLDPDWRPLDDPNAVGQAGRLFALAQFLRQVTVEFGVLGDGDAQRALAAELDALRVSPTRSRRTGG
jgi:hypothetical protein